MRRSASIAPALLTVLAAAAALTFGCSSGSPPPEGGKGGRAVSPASPEPGSSTPGAGALPAGKLPAGAVALVGDRTIGEKEFRELLAGMAQRHSEGSARATLEKLIDAKVLEGEAERKGYRNDPEVGRRLEEFRRKTLAGLYVQELRKEYVAREPVSEKDLGLPPDFGKPRYDTSVILVASLEDATAVYEELKAGASFPDLAKKHSIGNSADRGGELGPRDESYFQRMFDTSFESLKLEPGKVSNPIETPVGWLIIRLNSLVQDDDLQGKLDRAMAGAQERKAGMRFDQEVQRKMVQDIPARWNQADLDAGLISPNLIRGKGEMLPEDVLAVLGDYRVTREDVKKLNATIVDPKYTGTLTDLVENMLVTEHFSREAARKKPALLEGSVLKDSLDRQISILMRQKLIYDAIEQGIKVEDAEVEAYYKANPRQFRHGQQWELYHMLLRDQETADKAVQMIDAGVEFTLIARKLSLDNLRDKGGLVGIVERGQLEPRFDSALADLQAGKRSGVIKDQDGFHVLWCSKVIPAADKSLEDARREIYRTLWSQKDLAALASLQAELRKGIAILVDEPLVARIEQEVRAEALKMGGMGMGAGTPSGMGGMGGMGMGSGMPASHPPVK